MILGLTVIRIQWLNAVRLHNGWGCLHLLTILTEIFSSEVQKHSKPPTSLKHIRSHNLQMENTLSSSASSSLPKCLEGYSSIIQEITKRPKKTCKEYSAVLASARFYCSWFRHQKEICQQGDSWMQKQQKESPQHTTTKKIIDACLFWPRWIWIIPKPCARMFCGQRSRKQIFWMPWALLCLVESKHNIPEQKHHTARFAGIAATIEKLWLIHPEHQHDYK